MPPIQCIQLSQQRLFTTGGQTTSEVGLCYRGASHIYLVLGERRDGEPVWNNPALCADETKDYGADEVMAGRFLRALAGVWPAADTVGVVNTGDDTVLAGFAAAFFALSITPGFWPFVVMSIPLGPSMASPKDCLPMAAVPSRMMTSSNVVQPINCAMFNRTGKRAK